MQLKLTNLILLTSVWFAEGSIAASEPPQVAREFRAAWIATVQNIDWPSKPGLASEDQQRELIQILDKAVELNLNAVVLQIRPAADALYASKLEPWSPYLTGRMGRPPQPYYDPLHFAIDEAHRRGLQLHVWFNPYRVRMAGARGPASPDHASRALRPAVREYGDYLWFDPGEPAAEEHFIAVLNDVVTRYDIDGVHIDDYFYPYQTRDDAGRIVPFPDDESYARALEAGETLSRDDWRRQNVDRLIRRMYEDVKRAKPWVLVGVSPFGIWRPGHPEGITGLDQYDTLYADARKWFHEGWLDYMTPQLYWRTDSEGQNYAKLLGWWSEQNLKGRHLWPGNFTSRVRRSSGVAESRNAWAAEELLRQIDVTRAQRGAAGNVHFSMKALMRDYDGIATKLKAGPYATPALIPESSWLGEEMPPSPQVKVKRNEGRLTLDMGHRGMQSPWLWVVQLKSGDEWQTAIVPGDQRQHAVDLPADENASEVFVSAVTRLGRQGPPARVTMEDRD